MSFLLGSGGAAGAADAAATAGGTAAGATGAADAAGGLGWGDIMKQAALSALTSGPQSSSSQNTAINGILNKLMAKPTKPANPKVPGDVPTIMNDDDTDNDDTDQ